MSSYQVHDIAFADLQPHLLRGDPFIDVRAPIEFQSGGLPNSVNLPLMDDEQRARVGTCFKFSGREAAIQLGHKLVSGDLRERRIRDWQAQLRRHPQTVVYCARGGLRSGISSRWMATEFDIQCDVLRLAGGLKAARTSILSAFSQWGNSQEFLVLSGTTGSAKTHIINSVSHQRAAIDLEGVAKHRGSAFGAMEQLQPNQVNFENELYVKWLQMIVKHSVHRPGDPSTRILLEDESRLIGFCVIPEAIFTKMRSSEVVLVEEPIDVRVENIFTDYISLSPIGESSRDPASQSKFESAVARFQAYKKSTQAISRKLGGLRTQEILRDLISCEQDFLSGRLIERNRLWIEKLLAYYYDPMYLGSLSKRDPRIVFRGQRSAIENYLRENQ